jgi:uncharacterized membrane protein YkoI
MRRYTPSMSRSAWLALVPLALLVALPQSHGAGEEGRGKVIERGPGEVRKLSEILAIARRIVPGKVIDVELESDVSLDDEDREPRWVYEIEILTEDNRVVELEFDAKTGKLLEIEGAPWPADIPKEKP